MAPVGACPDVDGVEWFDDEDCDSVNNNELKIGKFSIGGGYDVIL